MQTPYEKAATLYPDEESFQADILPHLASGYVIASPTLFALFRPVDSKAPPALIANPWVKFGEPDAWFVWMLAGKPADLWALMPYPLPLVGFARFGQPSRFYPMQRAKEIACVFLR